MTYGNCDGGYVPEWQAAHHDGMAWRMRGDTNKDLTVRKAMRARMTRDELEARAIRWAEAMGDPYAMEEVRTADPEADRLAADHGFTEERIIPYRSLAKSRGVPLADVLRAALGGELDNIVRMPRAETSTRRD